jgi:hypothetical protein
MRPEGLGNLIKIIHLIGSRTYTNVCVCIYVNIRFGGIYQLHLHGQKQLRKKPVCSRCLSSPEDMSDHIRGTQHYIPEDGTIYSYYCANFRYYNSMDTLYQVCGKGVISRRC